MILSWNDGERDVYFTGKTCRIGYVLSVNKSDAKVFEEAEELGDAIETLLCDNFSPIKVEEK